MVTKNQKEEIIKELKEKFSRAKSVYSAKQLGLSVAQITALRKEIRPLNAEIKIAKNTLFNKAAEGTQYADLVKTLKGPMAFLFCYDDPVAQAGKVSTFAKKTDDKVEIEAAFLDGQTLDKEGANRVAKLPSKDVILSQIAGMLVQNTQSIAYILSQLAEKEPKEKQLKEFIVATQTVDEASKGSEQ